MPKVSFSTLQKQQQQITRSKRHRDPIELEYQILCRLYHYGVQVRSKILEGQSARGSIGKSVKKLLKLGFIRKVRSSSGQVKRNRGGEKKEVIPVLYNITDAGIKYMDKLGEFLGFLGITFPDHISAE